MYFVRVTGNGYDYVYQKKLTKEQAISLKKQFYRLKDKTTKCIIGSTT